MDQKEKIKDIKDILERILVNPSQIGPNSSLENEYMIELTKLAKEYRNEKTLGLAIDLMDMMYNAMLRYPRDWINKLQRFTYVAIYSIYK